EAFKYLKPLEETPETPKEIVIRFEKGVPVALDGVKMPLEELVMELNKIGGMHGYGYIDHIEDRVVGLKSREVYEAPAALILINAHIDLEKMVLGRRTLEFKKIIEEKWANMVYSGLWVDPLMNALNAFIDETQKEVSGEVRVKLYKGSARIVGRRAEKPLYHEEFITYTSKSLFDQRAGEYFSKLWGLETHLWYMRRGSRR
ncbi:MAG: argininosuccinate synthase, partial [Nitrososphaerota archaeon]